MNDDDPVSAAPTSTSRYEFEEVLGKGGMAVVHRVRDRASGRSVALKRLLSQADESGHGRIVALFEREYLTLVQLAHPCVVEAYDYGVDELGPYYTMELLDGGDLQTLAPVPWQRLCTLARDVCSALALLHSRRLVYRDLSPRNVRCTGSGTAKLIDFGAMTSMGPSREFVGTMPFVPPEALHQQALDGRTDLYALGATLYYALVGRHAYPARDATQLRDLWRSRPRRPLDLVPEIPEALDRLVLDLLQLDPSARPANASEVMARLSAIAGLRSSEHVLVSQSYLSNPALVGRSEQLAQARKLVLRALHQRGSAIMIQGEAGAGRSRLLDACVLEAKLAGLTVLRADASDAQAGSYGVARALAKQLLRVAGPLAREAASADLPLLGLAIPELLEDGPPPSLEDEAAPGQQHRRAQQALRNWLLTISRRRPLMLAIDDVPRIDEASSGCLTLLSQELTACGLVIVTSVGDEDRGVGGTLGPLQLLASASLNIKLTPLTPELTEQLLASLFGDVPNLRGLARYVHSVSSGNPRDIMRLAQHLVTERVVIYQIGSWSVPPRLDAANLPTSMADALRVRVESLSADARALALAFALEPKQTFSFDDCGRLGRVRDATPAQLLQNLDEVLTAELLARAGERYQLRQTSSAAVIASSCTAPQLSHAHLCLADVFTRRADDFRAAHHLMKGGALERGLDTLLEHAVQSEKKTDANAAVFAELLRALPNNWLEIYELGLRLCDQLGRPARDSDVLRSRLCALVAFAASETDGYVHIETRIARLRNDCGLDDLAALPSTMDPGTRLRTALEAANARYQSMAEHERLGPPAWAIMQISKSSLTALGTIMFSMDYEACCRLPSLAPLIPLSPALEIVCGLVKGLGARLIGRVEEAIATYEGLLARMAQPDRAGLTEAHFVTTRLRIIQGLGMLEAAMGQSSVLERAKELERVPLFAIQAMLMRQIHEVWQGEQEQADRSRQAIEIERIESNAHHGFEGPHLLSELVAYTLSEDLTRVKRITGAIEACATVHRAWVPVVAFGRGEYQRIRGDYAAALVEHERALALVPHGRHQIWAYAAGAHLRTLTALERAAEACTLAEAYLQTAGELGLGYLQNYIRMPWSLALSRIGKHTEAVALAQAVLEGLQQLGSSGLLLAAAYETRARVAREADDQAGFEHYAALCSTLWHAGDTRLANAKHQRLLQQDGPKDVGLVEELSAVSQFTSILESCHDADERARCGLEFIARQSGASGGVIYKYARGRVSRVAAFGEIEVDEELDAWATTYLVRELDETEDTTSFSEPPEEDDDEDDDDDEKPSVPTAQRYLPVLLAHQEQRRHTVTGLALLATPEGMRVSYPSRLAAELSRFLSKQ